MTMRQTQEDMQAPCSQSATREWRATMTDSMDNARRAARDYLLSRGFHRGSTVGPEESGRATAAYIRSLIRDGDLIYLCELLTELPDSVLLKRFSLIAQALDTNGGEDHKAIGAHECDGVSGYLAAEIDAVIADLPTRAELTRDDYEEEAA